MYQRSVISGMSGKKEDFSVSEIQEQYAREGVASIEFPDLHLLIRREMINGNNVDIITFDGRVTGENSYHLNQKFNRFFSGRELGNVILDLSRLEYMNSTGVAILFAFFFKIKENDGRLLVGGMHPFLERVFDLMEIPGEITMCETLEDAKKAL